jgi:photosystem II stability/assembly factor-like uncharacterized protein
MGKIPIIFILVVGLTSSCLATRNGAESPSPTSIIDSDQATSPAYPTETSTLSPSPQALTPSPSQDIDMGTPMLLVPFSELKMINSLDGWASGSDGVWRTADGGLSWTDVTPADYLYFGYALDPQTAWVITQKNQGEEIQRTLLKTTDGGENWTLISDRFWQSEHQYIFYDQNNGLIYGCGAAAETGICSIYETHDGGLSWAPMTFDFDHHGYPIETPGQYLFCNICGDTLYFDLDRLVLAGGNMAQSADTEIPIMITMDRGQTWRYQQLSLPAGKFSPGLIDPYTPVFFGTLDGILAVMLTNEDYDSFGAAFYITQDGGQTWSFQSLIENVSDVAGWSRMDFINSQHLFFSCGADLCVSHDGAQTWQMLSSNLSFDFEDERPSVRQFDFTASQTGFAIAGEEWDQLSLWKTLDGGETWEMLTPVINP